MVVGVMVAIGIGAIVLLLWPIAIPLYLLYRRDRRRGRELQDEQDALSARRRAEFEAEQAGKPTQPADKVA